MSVSRRDFVALWSQAALAAHQHSTASPAKASPYTFRYLTPAEIAVVRRAAALIVPADDRSGGAAAARVEEYIDHVLAHGSAQLKSEWRSGLASLGRAKDLLAELTRLSKNEFAPKSKGDWFFILLKGAVVEAFYTSEEGINKELGYQGMGFLTEFPDFTQVAAVTPAGYRPLLKARS